MNILFIIIGLFFAGGVLCRVIDLLAPGLIGVTLEAFLSQFKRVDIIECTNNLCINGMIPDGMIDRKEEVISDKDKGNPEYIDSIEIYKICPTCDKTNMCNESKIEAYADIIEEMKAAKVEAKTVKVKNDRIETNRIGDNKPTLIQKREKSNTIKLETKSN